MNHLIDAKIACSNFITVTKGFTSLEKIKWYVSYRMLKLRWKVRGKDLESGRSVYLQENRILKIDSEQLLSRRFQTRHFVQIYFRFFIRSFSFFFFFNSKRTNKISENIMIICQKKLALISELFCRVLYVKIRKIWIPCISKNMWKSKFYLML